MKQIIRTTLMASSLLLSASAFANDITPFHSGTWFDANFDKQGFVIEVLDPATDNATARNALVYWFTFDDVGNPIWAMGTGETQGNSLTVTMTTTAAGARPPEMVTADPLDTWATVSFNFSDCNHATATFEMATNANQPVYELTRLTQIGDTDCVASTADSSGDGDGDSNGGDNDGDGDDNGSGSDGDNDGDNNGGDSDGDGDDNGGGDSGDNDGDNDDNGGPSDSDGDDSGSGGDSDGDDNGGANDGDGDDNGSGDDDNDGGN